MQRARGGLGIGLALVQRLVALHGGRVSAHSAGVGAGTELVVRLPLHAAVRPEPPVEVVPECPPSGAIRVLENDGTGFFTEATGSFLDPQSFSLGSDHIIVSARSVVLGDLDGDSVDDMLVAGTVYYINDNGYGSGYYGQIPSGPILATKVLINDGAGHLADQTDAWFPAPVNGDQFPAHDAGLGDLDGDGDLDLVLALDGYPYIYGVSVGYNRPLRVFETK